MGLFHYAAWMKPFMLLILASLVMGLCARGETTVQIGQQVTFSVTADGTPPFTYQWFKNNVKLASTESTYGFVTDANSSGAYKATVTNKAGSATTNDAVIVAVPVPAPVPGAPVSLWASPVPGTVDGGPDSSVELAIKFQSDVNGTISGIRFYKGKTNTGTHTASLWSSTGTLLASATFASETASGWQTVKFGVPVAILANNIYFASYHAANGHYSADSNYFVKVLDNPPLHGINSAFGYGTKAVFPTQSWQNANYWVDVIFSPNLPPAVIPPRIVNFSAEIK